MPFHFNLNELVDKFYDLNHLCHKRDKEYVEAQSVYLRLDAIRKTVFARIMADMEGKSQAAREQSAYMNETWVDWITKYTEAEINMNDARRKRDEAKMDWETCRSILSTKKSELDKLGGEE